jgi:carbamate kinase
MGPKAEAAARFVESGGLLASVGSLSSAPAALAGEAGTLVRQVIRA